MAYLDFQDFLATLKSRNELKSIDIAISPYLEITEIADRVMKSGGPALLFQNVVGRQHRIGTPNPKSAVMGHPSIHSDVSKGPIQNYEFPVAINTMGSRKRMSLALSVDDFEEHANRIQELIGLPADPPKSLRDALNFAPKFFEILKSTRPTVSPEAPCQEIVLQGDLQNIGREYIRLRRNNYEKLL